MKTLTMISLSVVCLMAFSKTDLMTKTVKKMESKNSTTKAKYASFKRGFYAGR